MKPGLIAAPRGLFSRLEPLPGKFHRGGLKEFIARLKRPYYRLTESELIRVRELAGNSDVLLMDGKTQVTWGDADGGFALMPLRDPIL